MVLHFFECWALAFLTLSAAILALSVYSAVIGNDLELMTLGKEAIVVAIASFIEAAGIWLIMLFAPAALRAMIIPGLVVSIIYKFSHLESWSRYEIIGLLLFQLVLSATIASLILGKYEQAICVLSVASCVLIGIALVSKSL